MVATSASAIGHDMSMSIEKVKDDTIVFETFTAKCEFDGVIAMSQVVPINPNPSKIYTVGKEQYRALELSGAKYTLIDWPPGYRPPAVKTLRK